MCGLVPVRPTAWQRAQFVVSNNSPRPVGVVASCAKAGARRDETMKGLHAHMLFAWAGGSAWPCGCGNKEQNGQPRFDMAQIPMRWFDGSQRQRVAQDALEASAFGSSIPAIKAMRTRSERLAACILIMRFAR